MRLDSLLGTAPERRLLPVEKLHRPTVAVMAVMTFAMTVIAAAALALSSAAGHVARGAENRLVVVIPSAVASSLPQALSVARSVPGVKRASAVPEADMRESLERWLGAAAASPELPVPALVTVDLAPGGDPAAVGRAVRARVPQAGISSESAELAPMIESLRAIQWLALALVVLIGCATAAAIVLAARGALDTHRPTVEIMHGIGATDAQLTRLFERKIAADAIAGAVAGFVGAAVLLAFVGASVSAAAADFAGSGPVRWLDLLPLAAVPVLAVLVAIGVARWTLLRALRETL